MEPSPLLFRDLTYIFLAAVAGGILAWQLGLPFAECIHCARRVSSIRPKIAASERIGSVAKALGALKDHYLLAARFAMR